MKAEQYLRDVMMRYRNKLVYNADTGEIRDDKKYMAMLEDFWFLAEKEDVVLKLLLFQEDKTLEKSRTLSILRKSYTDHLTCPRLVWMAKVDLISVDPPKSSETN